MENAQTPPIRYVHQTCHRSSEIISLLNRFGHVAGYKTIIRLETAMANSVLQCERLLPLPINVNNNKVLHFCWDNFDLNEETTAGSNTTHSTHGIVLQEIKEISSEYSPNIMKCSITNTLYFI